jgi:hypothetical protein
MLLTALPHHNFEKDRCVGNTECRKLEIKSIRMIFWNVSRRIFHDNSLVISNIATVLQTHKCYIINRSF